MCVWNVWWSHVVRSAHAWSSVPSNSCRFLCRGTTVESAWRGTTVSSTLFFVVVLLSRALFFSVARVQV